MINSLYPLVALFLPFVAWAVEVLLPAPYLVEELLKAGLVYYLVPANSKSEQIKKALIAGVLFAFSESIFYWFRILQTGTIQTYFLRLLLTIPLHSLTFVILASWGLKKGLVWAVIIHFAYNWVLGYIL